MKPTRNNGSLGSNVKVHFAGSENVDFARILHEAGVNYFLFTVLPYIMDQFDIKWGRVCNALHLLPQIELPKFANHVIMDSGLFSIMFGACKETKPDADFMRRYKDAIVQFIHQYKAYNITVVDCDCQKLLGTDLAWELRTQMREQIPNRMIDVFHFEDGRKGLDRMIEFAEYIAISVPELRKVKPKTYREDTYQLASYIKDKKPEIDIHLLGGTEKKLLERCRFCTSADSTSWQQVNRYGSIFGRYKTCNIKEEKVQQEWKHIEDLLLECGVKPNENRIRYYYNFYLAGIIMKQEYTRCAGNQD